MTGYEIAEQIRKDPELGGMRLIAFTGYQDPTYRERAMKAGFDDFYLKPVDPTVLYQLFSDSKNAFTR